MSLYLKYGGCIWIELSVRDVESEIGDAPGRLVLGLAVVGAVVAHASVLDHELTPVDEEFQFKLILKLTDCKTIQCLLKMLNVTCTKLIQ